VKSRLTEFLVCVALLALVSFLGPGQPGNADTETIPVDTNGQVPLKSICQPEGNPKWNGKGKIWVGRYQWKPIREEGRVKEIRGTIYLNECRMRELGYTPQMREKVFEHERAHALLGLDHGEGTPETNPAYYANYGFDDSLP